MTINSKHPYHPIIYVRGFAATQSEIDETVSDPYMGFNIGSTKARVAWNGDIKRYYFESPLVRLMGDHKYEDVFVDGDDLVMLSDSDHPVPYRCIVIYRYYDEASTDFGTGIGTPPIEHFAIGLGKLILRLRDRVCANPHNKISAADFRVYLVAHSMGGLICRAFLQNRKLGSAAARLAVDKLFTYATPHNGIDMRIVRNVPGWLSFGDANNFNRNKMAEYLDVPKGDDVSVVKNFPPERIFNLIGTNARDYSVAGGMSAWAAGEASDGLVRIENATTHGPNSNGDDVQSPQAFVNRSHSGPYGIVNSEEGYQNLTRFLFGALRVDGILDIDDITLPLEVHKAFEIQKQEVNASYQFETAVSIRGVQWQLTRREVRENSAIFRSYNDLFPGESGTHRPPDRNKSPHLFTVFLDPKKSVKNSKSVSFAFDLKVVMPDYEVGGLAFLKRHYEGSFIYRELILVEVVFDSSALGGWRIKYGYQDLNPGKPGRDAVTRILKDCLAFDIPIEQNIRPGLHGTLRIEVRPWR